MNKRFDQSRRFSATGVTTAPILKPYRTMIWVRGSDLPGKRVTVLAESLSDAKRKLEAEYGEGNVFDLHNEEEAARAR
jgi:hypothetical protein